MEIKTDMCLYYKENIKCKTCDGFGDNRILDTKDCYQSSKDFYERMMENK